MLLEYFRSLGLKTELVEVPVQSSGVTHDVIYWMLKNGLAKKLPNVFQFVQFLNKLAFQMSSLIWLMMTRDVIIMDRWSLSSIVYGDATGANKTLTRVLYRLLVRPTITVVLSGRRHTDQTEDTYEADTDLQRNVRVGYADWAESHSVDHVLVDNQGTKEEVNTRILNAVIPMLHGLL
jgi:thymidylate kinase